MGTVCALLLGTIAFAQTMTLPVLEFVATGDTRAHDEFILGVIDLHSSSYIEAAQHFRKAEKIDQNFFMAYWGEAMTFNHPFWDQQDIAGARRALAKLGPTRAARAAKVPTPREREYLNAVEILYGDGNRDSRDFAFEVAMKNLAFHYPSDYEAAAFYVLALLSSRRIGDPNYEQTQSTAGAILNAILEKYPNHPGALHYLMHTYDDPEHAPLALDAARKYERVPLPDSNFHAIHMPSHIYVQLGMWPDVARGNQAAFDASDRWIKRNNYSTGRRDYHSLEFLQYAEMQMGQYGKAREALDVVRESARQIASPALMEEAAIMSSRLAIESRNWSLLLSPLAPETRIPELLLARGLAALDAGDVDGAKKFDADLGAVIQADVQARRLIHASTEETLEKLLHSRIAFAENQAVEGERLASEAVELERSLQAPAELSGVVKPAAEFYGELLLELKKPAAAEKQFAASLKERPRRALSMLGLARSLAAQNDHSRAAAAYRELAEMWSDADRALPALAEVRSYH
jgi:hypothetical protein